MIKKFENYLNENDGGGISNSTLGNTGGMGNVVAPQPSNIPGDVSGSIKGSGDLPAYDNGKKFVTNPFRRKSKKKKGKKTLGEDYRNMYVTKFTDWNYIKENEDWDWSEIK